LTLRELGGSRRQLGRLPPLRFLQRRLRVGQLAREGVAVGNFLSEPDFDFTLALPSVRGGQLFGRGALFGLLPRGRGVGQPEFERLPRGGRLCERGGELRLASNESLSRGSRACRDGPVATGTGARDVTASPPHQTDETGAESARQCSLLETSRDNASTAAVARVGCQAGGRFTAARECNITATPPLRSCIDP